MRMIWSSRFCPCQRWRPASTWQARTHLEAFVLKHALDGGVLAAGRQLCLEDDSKGAIADDFALCIRQVLVSPLADALRTTQRAAHLVFAREAVLDLLTDDFCAAVSMGKRGGAESPHLPF
jgi:hypothetical protein